MENQTETTIHDSIDELRANMHFCKLTGGEIPNEVIEKYKNLLRTAGLSDEEIKQRVMMLGYTVSVNIGHDDFSLTSAKEAYELPTDYKASWELEKGIREVLERENKELRKGGKREKELEKELQTALEQKTEVESALRKVQIEARTVREINVQSAKDFNEAVARVDKLDKENKKLTDSLSKLQIQHNNLKESNTSLRKSVINYSSRSTTYLYLSIFLGVAAAAELVGIVLLLNR